MERAALGTGGVEVTRFALGGAALGGLFTAVGEAQARATVDAAWDHGVRYFDTAPHYAAGVSERRLGAALRTRPRDEVVVSTKVGRLLVPPGTEGAVSEGIFAGEPDLARRFDFSRDGVRRALEGSLERLGLDRVDVVLVHDPDEPAQLDQTIAEAVPELLRMREEGTIRAVGAGMNFPGPLARIVRDTDVDCVLVAGRHTLLDRSAAAELLPLCAERAVGVIAGGVFNSGILADPGGAATYEYAPAPAALLQRARAIAAVCARHDVTLPAAAMAFARRHPAVTCLLVGARSSEEVAANVEAFGRPVPDALWSELEAERLLPDGVAA